MRNCRKAFALIAMMTASMWLPVNISAEEAEIEKETYECEMVSGEECIIIDNEACTMKIVDVDPEGEWGYTWQIYLKNKTDKELMFDLADVSVNGMMCDPYWAMEIEAGMEANEEISWEYGEFEEYGIGDVTVVEFTLNAYDNNDWEAGNIVYNDYKIYLTGKDDVTLISRESEPTDTVLFDTEECSMVAIGIEEDGIWGTELNVYFENKSEKDLMVSFEDVSVNGYMCDPYWGMVVTAGNRSYAAISWMEEDFEDNGIETIEEVQGTVFVYDNDNWGENALVEKEITVNAE